MLEERAAFLLDQIVLHESLTIHQLSKKTNLTRRQIEYDLVKINDWLKENELPLITYKGAQPFCPPGEVKEFFLHHQPKQNGTMYFSDDLRSAVTYLLLFARQEPVSTYHLNDFLHVSRNTSMAVIKSANLFTGKFRVTITYTREHGYHLQGAEADKRTLALQCITELIQKKNGIHALQAVLEFWDKQVFWESETITEKLEKDFSLQFVEERIKGFQYFLPFYFLRLKQRKFITFASKDKGHLLKSSMLLPANMILEYGPGEIPEEEAAYMVTHLLGLSLGELADEDDLLLSLCENMIRDFETSTCTYLKNKQQIARTLYQHMKPAYYRVMYGIPIINVLLDQIKQQHAELYTIMKQIVLPVENILNLKFPEDEIGYLTIHFGALIENHRQPPGPVRAVIVCPGGISSSLMIKHVLGALFPDLLLEKAVSIQEFNSQSPEKYDLVFSTVYVETTKPLFMVKPVMTAFEKQLLLQQVHARIFRTVPKAVSVQALISEVRKYAAIHDEQGLTEALHTIITRPESHDDRGKKPVLNELITEEMVQLIPAADSWEAAIHLAAMPLIESCKIEERYVDAIIANVKEYGPYIIIGPGIAIPHARPEDGALQVGMSILKVDEPVYVSGNEVNPVSLFICIAAVDSVTHLKAMAQLTRLLTDKNNQQRLTQAASKEDILALISQYSLT